jgi:GNAT superfamily N-acetyltransferase
VELRPTADDDLSTLHALFVDAVAGVYAPHAFAAPAPRLAVFESLQRHVLATGDSVVADDGGELLGYAAAWQRGEDWFLSSLFVAPAAQGRRVGTALLDAVWGEAPRRRTITDSIQPVSNALYGRRGLVPATPVLRFTGRPRALAAAVDPADADLAAVDAAAYGFDRGVDHDYWSRHARRTTWPGAYSYAFPGGDLGPIGGIDGPSAAAALAAELARADGEVRLRVPGSSRALVEVALAAGLRLDAVPGLLLLSQDVSPPTSLAIAGYALF